MRSSRKLSSKRSVTIANEVAYPACSTLFEEGDEGDSLYLLVEGEVSIIKAGTEVLFFNEKGYCLGEIALIDSKPRSATVKTVKPTQLLRITRDDFYNAMAREPRIGSGMFRVLNDKIRRDLEIQMSAIRKEVAQEESMRLAAEVQQSLFPEPRNCASIHQFRGILPTGKHCRWGLLRLCITF